MPKNFILTHYEKNVAKIQIQDPIFFDNEIDDKVHDVFEWCRKNIGCFTAVVKCRNVNSDIQFALWNFYDVYFEFENDDDLTMFLLKWT
jgi:hypothetical protein